MRGTSAAARICGAAVETDEEGLLAIVSAHGPTTWEDDAAWFTFVSDLSEQVSILSALGGQGRVQFLAGGDRNVDLDGDSDRLASLEETQREWQPIRGPPTFARSMVDTEHGLRWRASPVPLGPHAGDRQAKARGKAVEGATLRRTASPSAPGLSPDARRSDPASRVPPLISWIATQ